jgi:purine-cytosine permease-like protein
MDSEQLLPPVPRALSDEELQEVLDRAKAEGGGVLAAMQILEAQAQLRETDKSELRAWHAQNVTQSELPQVLQHGDHILEGGEEQEATAADELLVNVGETTSEPFDEPVAEPAAETFIKPVAETFIETVVEPLSQTVLEMVAPAKPAESPVEIVLDATELKPQVHSGAPAVPVQTEVEVMVQTKRFASDPSSSQFWAWLPISGSLLPLGISLWLSSLGLSLGQSMTAALLGIFVSAGVVAVGAIAGKRSSLPTLVLSRAAFGVFGNLAPAVILVISRLFWALVLVSLGYLLIAQNVTSTSRITGVAAPISWSAVAVLAAIVAAGVILSSLGGRKLVWAQRISGVFGLLTALTVAIARFVDGNGSSAASGSGTWLTALGASVVIFAVFGLAWSSASSDYASGLPVNTRGWKVAGWALISMGIIPAMLACLGLFAFGRLNDGDFVASFDAIVAGGSTSVLSTAVQISLVVTLITVIAMSLRSSSMSFDSIHLGLKVSVTTPIIAVVAVALSVLGLSRLGASGFWLNLEGYAIFVAVPVAAWSGVFLSDVLIRRIAYHEVSLSRGYGFYRSINPANFFGWVAAVAIGWGLLGSKLVEFQWLGYLARATTNFEFWSQSHFGVVIAFAIGLLLPVAAGIPRIKRQEAEVLAIESRRNDLRDVLGLVD